MSDIDRLIGRALRDDPSRGLPADFAARMAARAAAGEFSRFESVLLVMLVAALVVCGVSALARFGGYWMREALANGWIVAFAACVGVSWLMGRGHWRAQG
jgi:hypothetical protein